MRGGFWSSTLTSPRRAGTLVLGLTLIVGSSLWLLDKEPVVPLQGAEAVFVPRTVSQKELDSLRALSLKYIDRAPRHSTLSEIPAAQVAPADDEGLPRLLYMGGDFCPYCAAVRWPILLTLLRFGHVSGVETMRSSPNDSAPDSATFTFAALRYQSDTIRFQAVEMRDRDSLPFQTPDAEQKATFLRYDAAPFTTSPGSIPFTMIGTHWVKVGAHVDPTLLKGLDWKGVENTLASGQGPLWTAVFQSADAMSAALCQLTRGHPENVCQPFGIPTQTNPPA